MSQTNRKYRCCNKYRHRLQLTNVCKQCIILFGALQLPNLYPHLYGGVKVSTGVLKCDKRAENGVISITCATFKYKRKK